ncbi:MULTISPECIES: carbohydrate ABC transporter permease [Paenibacillus]|uniref:Sugar ABC transporter permease n=1 Tax=Paenibacillus baimaensis TaxID=2982185 RepID=A0ABT2U8H7_9BACL|nr:MULTISPECIES: sugar ABC transporter permease [unclassified Paenibacillus]MCU6790933.1 sugar ABC transporter permease [Paenibacillus sp. WQ 127069]OMF20883.1 hypothetical protein BK127_02270 [Paenibacillus sp. FSL H7-0331]
MGLLAFRKTVILFMLPSLLIYGLFFVVPFAQTFYFSFFEWSGIGKKTFLGFKNYIDLMHDPLFLNGFWRVLIWALLAIVIKDGLALVLASVLRKPIRGSNWFTTVFFLPVVISTAAIGLMFSLMYDKDIGLLNLFLQTIGLGDWSRSWLADENTAFYAVIAAPLWHTIGYFFIILLAGMQNIPEEVYEAATLDGAGAWTQFTRITIPLIWPILQICMILSITGAFKSFDYVFIMTKGGPGESTQVPATYMYETVFVGMKYGYGTAIAILIFVFSLVVTLLFRKLTTSKEQ